MRGDLKRRDNVHRLPPTVQFKSRLSSLREYRVRKCDLSFIKREGFFGSSRGVTDITKMCLYYNVNTEIRGKVSDIGSGSDSTLVDRFIPCKGSYIILKDGGCSSHQKNIPFNW